MSFSRFVKKMIVPGYNTADAIRKIRDYGLVDGMKEKFREDFLEDTPGISHVYNSGRYEGKKEGYVEASHEYENKLLKQADEFLNKTKDFESQREKYEQLIDDYEQYIDELSRRDDLSSEEDEYLKKLLIMERKLKKAM